MHFGRNLPELFDSQSIGLRRSSVAEVELVKEGFRQRTTATFGQHRVSATQLHSTFKIGTRSSILLDADITGCNTADLILVIVENFGSSDSRIDFHTQLFRLFSEPGTQLAKTNDVVSVVVKSTNHRNRDVTGLSEQFESIRYHRRIDRCILLLPVRNQLIQSTWFENRTRKNVRSNFGTFFDDANTKVLVVRRCQLLQSDGGRETRRSTTNDDHIELIGEAFLFLLC
mmetsp:Transcript_30608/g.76808  ORF Transcript_30608/g.76808 Transcript_30608/m.76808 type:complete len:228 (-) Transcript_30608:304-987(-)